MKKWLSLLVALALTFTTVAWVLATTGNNEEEQLTTNSIAKPQITSKLQRSIDMYAAQFDDDLELKRQFLSAIADAETSGEEIDNRFLSELSQTIKWDDIRARAEEEAEQVALEKSVELAQRRQTQVNSPSTSRGSSIQMGSRAGMSIQSGFYTQDAELLEGYDTKTPVESVGNDTFTWGKFDLINESGASEDVQAIIKLVDINSGIETMHEAVVMERIVADNGNETFIAGFNVPENGDFEIRADVWDGNGMPLIDTITIEPPQELPPHAAFGFASGSGNSTLTIRAAGDSITVIRDGIRETVPNPNPGSNINVTIAQSVENVIIEGDLTQITQDWSSRPINSFSASGLTSLTYLALVNARLIEFDEWLPNLTNLILYCSGYLTSFSVRGLPNLTSLYLRGNFSEFIGEGLSQITNLLVSSSQPYSFIGDGLDNLVWLDLFESNVSSFCGIGMNSLTNLNLSSNQLTELDVTNNFNLVHLGCYCNQMTELDISNNPNLEYLICPDNQLTKLDLANNPNLIHLDCDYNQLTKLDLTSNSNLIHLNCSGNRLTGLNVKNNPMLEVISCGDNYMPSANCVFGLQHGTWLDFSPGWPDFGIDITSEFTDPKFLAAVGSALGKSAGAPIYYGEAWHITSLYLGNGISSLDGIEYLGRLEHLDCSGNQFAELDLTSNHELKYLYCINNHLTELDLTYNPILVELICYNNQLTALNLTNNTNLVYLDCSNNELIELNVTNNTALESLNCYDNELTWLDVSNNTALIELSCVNNYMSDEYSVTGWEEIGLVLDGTFSFNPQHYGNPPAKYEITNELYDENFRAAVREILGKVPDAPIYDREVENITRLDVSSKDISDLGLYYFTGLKYLDVSNNQLWCLDVSYNPLLSYIGCRYNYFDSMGEIWGWNPGIDIDFYPQW